MAIFSNILDFVRGIKFLPSRGPEGVFNVHEADAKRAILSEWGANGIQDLGDPLLQLDDLLPTALAAKGAQLATKAAGDIVPGLSRFANKLLVEEAGFVGSRHGLDIAKQAADFVGPTLPNVAAQATAQTAKAAVQQGANHADEAMDILWQASKGGGEELLKQGARATVKTAAREAAGTVLPKTANLWDDAALNVLQDANGLKKTGWQKAKDTFVEGWKKIFGKAAKETPPTAGLFKRIVKKTMAVGTLITSTIVAFFTGVEFGWGGGLVAGLAIGAAGLALYMGYQALTGDSKAAKRAKRSGPITEREAVMAPQLALPSFAQPAPAFTPIAWTHTIAPKATGQPWTQAVGGPRQQESFTAFEDARQTTDEAQQVSR